MLSFAEEEPLLEPIVGMAESGAVYRLRFSGPTEARGSYRRPDGATGTVALRLAGVSRERRLGPGRYRGTLWRPVPIELELQSVAADGRTQGTVVVDGSDAAATFSGRLSGGNELRTDAFDCVFGADGFGCGSYRGGEIFYLSPTE